MQPILSVDLSNGEIGQVAVPREWQERFLGGASLAARILYAELVPELDPLSPAAPLLFLTGPLTGTSGPAVGRFVIAGRSPATGLWAESNCGGFWGPELRKAGYDGLLVRGQSNHPVILWIHDRQVELLPADAYWGMQTYKAQKAIQESLGVAGTRVAVIGPAGEAQIPFALILSDHGRVAGRTGMGAVMGAKRLKAVAVKGRGTIPLARRDTYVSLRSAANRKLRDGNQSRVLRELGTASAAEYFDYLGEMPKRYFQRQRLGEELKVTGTNLKEEFLVGVSACHACVIACGRVVRLGDGAKRKGPEYETMVGFGPNLGLNDLEFTSQMGELCDRYGMDSISMSNVIGLALSLYEQGRISQDDSGGLALRWGDPAVVEQLVHLTARQQGIGALLAQGSRAFGGHFGAQEQAVQVNGLEVPYHDPRGASGMALVYATSPRGACHNQSDYYMADIGQVEPSLGMEYYQRRAGAEKAANVARHQDWRTLFNALVMCVYTNLEPLAVVELVNAALGLDWDLGEALAAGERGWNLKRAINNRLGLRRANDTLPKALRIPYADAQNDDERYVPDLDAMLAAYYQERDWDPASGFPRRQKLISLGLDWVAEDLYRVKKAI